MLFRFYCDESYDGKALNPDYFTISGFFSDQPSWEEVENDWSAVNLRYGVSAFHATELNRRKGRYEGWCRNKGCEYSGELLECINRQKQRMRAYNCEIRGDAYRSVISGAGQIKLGHPWMVCFKSIVCMIAKDMEDMPKDDSFSVVLGRENRFDNLAAAAFGEMTVNPHFSYRSRLMTCTPGDPESIIGLQVADLMAYEYYKRMRDGESECEPRPPLKLIQTHNGYCEGFFGEKTFQKLKDGIEAAICGPDELVVIPQL
jgi:hypothetical protein